MKKKLVTGLIAIGLAHAQSLSITGQIRTNTGAPLPNATIAIARKLAIPPIPGHFPISSAGFAATAKTTFSGGFEVPSKLDGRHIVCVNANDGIHLDPCTWGGPQEVSLVSNQARAVPAINLQRGVTAQITIDDPDGLLGPPETPNPKLTVAFQLANGLLIPLSPYDVTAHRNGRGSIFRYIAPYKPDLDVKLQLLCPVAVVRDDRGTALRRNGTSAPSIRAKASDTAFAYRFTITRN